MIPESGRWWTAEIGQSDEMDFDDKHHDLHGPSLESFLSKLCVLSTENETRIRAHAHAFLGFHVTLVTF